MKTSVVFVYNSFKDPLFMGNLFLYLKNSTKSKKYFFYVITYEQKDYFISALEKKEIKNKLINECIYWIPLKWHSGHLKLLKKTYDFFCALIIIMYLRLFKKVNHIISLGTVAGSLAYIFSRLFFMRCFLYQYEPHSEFLLDFGLLKKKSISFYALNYLEKISGKNAEVISTGTSHMINRLKKMKSKAQLFYIPSCVNEELFVFNPFSRKKNRNEFGFKEEDIVLVYLGKFGGIYYQKEIPQLFSFLHKHDKNWKLLIISLDAESKIHELCHNEGIDKSHYKICSAVYNKVPEILSCADIGLVALPPLPSQQYRSPIKVGEYLCCGLPYIVCRGISEDDYYAEKFNIGVVLEDFSLNSLTSSYSKIEEILSEDKYILRERCRNIGIRYRGFSKRNETMLDVFRVLFNYKK